MIEGYVQDVRYEPGRPHGEIYVSLRGEPGAVTVLLKDPAAAVKLDGETYLPGGMVKLLYLAQSGSVYFRGEELPGRYRTCRAAEFRTGAG